MKFREILESDLLKKAQLGMMKGGDPTLGLITALNSNNVEHIKRHAKKLGGKFVHQDHADSMMGDGPEVHFEGPIKKIAKVRKSMDLGLEHDDHDRAHIVHPTLSGTYSWHVDHDSGEADAFMVLHKASE